MGIGIPITQNTASQTQPTDREDAKLRKVCQDFESVLVAHMLSKMRETVPKTNLFGSGREEEIFRSLLDQEIAKEISRTGAMKLADLVYAQLSRLSKNR